MTEATGSHDQPGRMPSWFLVREMFRSSDRDIAAALLAGGKEAASDALAPGVRLFASCDPSRPPANSVVGVAVIVPHSDGVVELGRVALALPAPDPSMCERLLRSLAARLRTEGWRAIVRVAGPEDDELVGVLGMSGFRRRSRPTPDGKVWLHLEL